MTPLQLPVAALQGKWMRATLQMAPPAEGPTSGTVGTSSHPPLRVAVAGESTAAGCGVDRHDEGFIGSLAREMAERTQRPVQWHVAGQAGATARRIRYRLVPQLGHDLDVVVLLSGGNDVMSGRGPREWREDLSAIVDDLLQRAHHVVVAGTPPFEQFPAMPTILGRLLSERAAVLDDISQQVCAARPRTVWVTMTETAPLHFFAADRFHLSAAGYQRWAKVIADHLPLDALAHELDPTPE